MRVHLRNVPLALCVVAVTLIGGCTTADSEHARAAPPPPGASTAPATRTASTQADSAAYKKFAGTQWQLVEILSMDGASFKPTDGSLYTIDFTPGGRALVRADCNRAAATWTADGDSGLQFGAVASTRMKCSPDSLSERYLAQFEWVRSYVKRNGHLFLATKADGAIIEFEPVELK